jgi:hypothetical protein
MPPPRNVRDTALRIDELASNIHTPADARRLIDFIAELFADELPPAWATDSIRNRLAEREYLTVADPQKRISEERVAAAWDAYVTTLQAPDTSHVTTAEIHNLRDALFATARVFWNLGNRNFWAVPSIFAIQPGGTLAPGCRVVESLRTLWDIAAMPDSLRATRERVANGVLLSDLYRQAPQRPSSSSVGRAYVSGSVSVRGSSDPAGVAERRSSRKPSERDLANAIETMLNTLLSV